MRKNSIILIIIGVLILIGLISGFSFWLKFIKPEVKVDLCKEFPKIEGKVSCREAMEIALKKFPGEVYEIDKTQITLFTGEKGAVQEKKEDVWLIGINLKKPMEMVEQEQKKISNNIKVAVNRANGGLRIYQISWERP